MARQGIPLHHRDPRPAPHRSPPGPPSHGGMSNRAAEADDYAVGSADDYNWDEDRYGYPEATSYGREFERPRSGYRPRPRFAADPTEYQPRNVGSYGPRASAGAHARRGPKGYVRPDTRIHEDICDQLFLAGDIDASDVDVAVSGGSVTLSGSVPERRMKHRIEDICEAAAPNGEIDNRIRVIRGGNGDSTGSPA